MPILRPCLAGDIPAVTAIYAHHVLHGTGTFEITPPTEADMLGRHSEVLSRGLPYLVLEHAGQLAGFAYCNWFKPRPAYRFSAEDSIYLAPHCHGQGHGRLLLAELLTQAQRAGVRKLIAVIGDSANAGSIHVHRSQGFQHVGVLSACGWKFERWLDVVLMEKSLGLGSSHSPRQ
ncbi:MAG: GNAT family N-acetyltransferase [Gammaproteobacteria bacterium]|nr:GNAT family N-acetyltransferase [Gammaproteobacteria bacterium]MBU0788531.1 GNAT family N-acetyltransferase [Gammaproteobacteria bacterium]MBU0815645.1 GNAT family N-acetyltransferase [Gammaproteobacteria bacterium]MBU1788147.1 GNAT family N-acetyltransferase [Gammaproteobacteria bacterium]